MILERKNGETLGEYHKRLIYGKLVDKTLSDYDYSELAPYVYGKPYAADVARRLMYGSRYTLDLLAEEAESAQPTDENIDNKILELKKERQKFFDERTALNKIIRERSRQEELNDILVRTLTTSDALPSLPEIEENMSTPSNNDLLVSLNDIHYGATHDNYWNTYDSDICKKMMSNYLKRVIEIGKAHNSENCYVWSNGDSISGLIHLTIQISNKENIIEQVMGVSELISEFLAELGNNFKNVYFCCVSGNHSRLMKDSKEAPIDERLDDLIPWYVAARLKDRDNIFVNSGSGIRVIDPTMYLLNVRGNNFIGVHGDYDSSPSAIGSLVSMTNEDIYGVLLGHKHHNKIDVVQGVKTIMAGSFLGMDDFCIKKRICGRPEQLVCVCDNSGIVCYYDIPLD